MNTYRYEPTEPREVAGNVLGVSCRLTRPGCLTRFDPELRFVDENGQQACPRCVAKRVRRGEALVASYLPDREDLDDVRRAMADRGRALVVALAEALAADPDVREAVAEAMDGRYDAEDRRKLALT